MSSTHWIGGRHCWKVGFAVLRSTVVPVAGVLLSLAVIGIKTPRLGGVGAFLLTPEGAHAFGGMIPPHLRSQLTDPGGGVAKKQRNT